MMPDSMTTIKSRVGGAAAAACQERASWTGCCARRCSGSLIRRQRSEFVSGYLTGMRGIEIGASSHNRFYLDAINVDRFGGKDTVYKREERRLVMHAVKVDVVAPGDELPFEDDSYDFVFSSHVIEHFPDPIKALYEWIRVARRYVVVIAPHRDRTFDIDNPLTPVSRADGAPPQRFHLRGGSALERVDMRELPRAVRTRPACTWSIARTPTTRSATGSPW